MQQNTNTENLIETLTQLSRTTARFSIEKQEEILNETILGIFWLNEVKPSWPFSVRNHIKMEDPYCNIVAQVWDKRPVPVVFALEEVSKYDFMLERGCAIEEGESDDVTKLRNILWDGAVKFLREQTVTDAEFPPPALALAT